MYNEILTTKEQINGFGNLNAAKNLNIQTG